MKRFVSSLALLFLATPALWAQSTVPTVSQPLPNQAVTVGGNSVTVDLRNYFAIPGVTGQVAQFDTVMGNLNVELLANAAPRHVANFIAYASAGAYANTFFHRSASFDNSTPSIVQGGGYYATLPTLPAVAKSAPVALEYNLPNASGTLAAARTSDPNSATSEWYFNVKDNSTTLGPTSGSPGYTVFGRVLGTGMSVVNAIAALPIYNLGAGTAWETTPLRNVQSGQTQVLLANFVVVTSVNIVPLFPDSAGAAAVATFIASSSNPAAATVSIAGSQLNVSPVAVGTTTVTVTATDTNGNAVSGAFTVSVAAAGAAPVVTTPPASQYVAPGSNVTFSVAASGTGPLTYQWKLNGTAITGATSATYPVTNVQTGNMGFYSVTVGNGGGSVDSDVAILTVAAGSSRLTGLSTRGYVPAGGSLTPGFYLRGSGTKAVIVRAVGPTLGSFGVAGTLSDPRMDLIPVGAATLLSNDNWGTNPDLPALRAAMPFALAEGSLDAAALATLSTATNLGYTVRIGPSGTATTGIALAEVYDLDAANSPVQFASLSTLGFTGTGENVLTPGFIITGDGPKQLLIRAVGPTLGGALYNVAGALADPQFRVVPLNQNFTVAGNDNWGGTAALQTAFVQTYAFALPTDSRDAAAVVRLPPGGYTVQATGVGGTTGNVLVEVYDMDP